MYSNAQILLWITIYFVSYCLLHVISIHKSPGLYPLSFQAKGLLIRRINCNIVSRPIYIVRTVRNIIIVLPKNPQVEC